jgi:hypothetical protein
MGDIFRDTNLEDTLCKHHKAAARGGALQISSVVALSGQKKIVAAGACVAAGFVRGGRVVRALHTACVVATLAR